MEAFLGESSGSVAKHRATRAIIIYEALEGQYASVHPVINAGKGRPRLGPGEPITDQFTKEFLSSIGEDLKPEFLDHAILYRTHDVMIWWSPPERRSVRYRDGSELAGISGELLPIPGLVWRLDHQSLAVRALSDAARPRPDSPLYVAPFWNTSPIDGVVCEGTMKKPASRGPAAVDGWTEGFFASEFTHQAGAGSLSSHPAGYAGMMKELAGRAETYPTEHLVPAARSGRHTLLKDFLYDWRGW